MTDKNEKTFAEIMKGMDEYESRLVHEKIKKQNLQSAVWLLNLDVATLKAFSKGSDYLEGKV